MGELDTGDRSRHRKQRLLQPVCDVALRLELADVLHRDAELVADRLVEGDLLLTEDALGGKAERDEPEGPAVRLRREGDQPVGLCPRRPSCTGAAR